MLIDSPWLPFFELSFSGIRWGLETTESEVKPSNSTRDEKEIANEVIIQGVVEAQHENRHDSLEYFEECAELNVGSGLLQLLNLVFNRVNKHSNNGEETCAFLTNAINVTKSNEEQSESNQGNLFKYDPGDDGPLQQSQLVNFLTILLLELTSLFNLAQSEPRLVLARILDLTKT